MDESTNGKSSLRSVSRLNSNKRKSSPIGTNPREARRRELHLQRRNEQLTNLWRSLLFSSITYSLGFLVIKNGWSSINVAQIHVNGSSTIKSISIVDASGLNFPKPLFSINPKQLEASLIEELPLKNVSIRRRLIPPRLEIEVIERKPIAFADRRGPKGKEKGMIDKNGYWMPIRMATKTNPPTKDIYVEGWMPSHQSWISIILKNQEKLGSPLKKIIISPNGEIILKTKDFEMIYLGSTSNYIKEQIRALYKLSNNLPENFLKQTGTILDIRDPSRPEFQIPKSAFQKNLKN